jgi:hypothetical protein
VDGLVPLPLPERVFGLAFAFVFMPPDVLRPADFLGDESVPDRLGPVEFRFGFSKPRRLALALRDRLFIDMDESSSGLSLFFLPVVPPPR